MATSRVDPTADLVVAELNRRGRACARIDVGAFPASVSLSARLDLKHGWRGTLADEHRVISLEDIRAVYWRRPSPFSASTVPEGPSRDFAEREARLGMTAVLTSLSGVLWINEPKAVAGCTKPAQLVEMVAAGLDVPPTWIGNLPAHHNAFCQAIGAPVAKTLGPITHVDENGTRSVLNTARVPTEHWGHRRVAATANLLQQEVVDKSVEFRVAVVGDRLFASEIHVVPGVDYLDLHTVSDKDVTYRPAELPRAVAKAILEVTQSFGLVFAAWDLLGTADGNLLALELNPGGQWAFTPDRDQITEALADELEMAAKT